MSIDTQQTQDDNPSKKPDSFPKEIALKYDTKAIDNLTDAIRNQTLAQQQHQSVPKEDEGPKLQRTANTIAKYGLIVNGILAALTLVAIYISARALTISSDALKEAARAGNAAMIADSISLITLRRDSVKNVQDALDDSIKFQKQFGIASRSLGAQIQSLNKTQKNFEIENNPLIQVSNMRFDTLSVGHKTRFEFGIANFGKQPAMILQGKYTFGRWQGKDFQDFTVPMKSDNLDKIYIPGNLFSSHSWTERNPLTPQEYIYLSTEQISFYLLGEVKYLNTVTKTRWRYRFSVRIQLQPVMTFINVLNEIKPISK